MKKLAIIVLALAALSFGDCDIDDGNRYCFRSTMKGSDGFYIEYGGDRGSIEDAAGDLCEDTYAWLTMFMYMYYSDGNRKAYAARCVSPRADLTIIIKRAYADIEDNADGSVIKRIYGSRMWNMAVKAEKFIRKQVEE